MAMHVAIAVVTYNALVRIAPAGRPDAVGDDAVADPGAPAVAGDPAGPAPGEHPAAVHWLADYVYGTIATLVAIAGLTFESNPGELTTAGVVIVGAVAIWFAHTLSRLVSMRSRGTSGPEAVATCEAARHSWSIVTAAIPATIIFVLAALDLWTIHTGVRAGRRRRRGVALAVVGIGTAGGRDRPSHRAGRLCLWSCWWGAAIVLLEAGVHLL